jgi:DNA replication protein DnaC
MRGAERKSMMDEMSEPFRGYDLMLRLVGRRFANCWFKNFDVGQDEFTGLRQTALADTMEYTRKLKTDPRSGANLVFMGSCGTGKDHLSVSVVRAALSFGMSVRYTRGSVLCNECRRSMLENAIDVPEEIRKTDLLVISDIEPNSMKPATDFEERALLELIDYRYSELLPTVISTNKMSRTELSKTIGERTVDRLWHGAVLIPMSWPTYRKC